VPGRSVEYVLARLRPMDMMPPIWLCARRWRNQKMPTNRATGMSSGASASSNPGCGFSKVTSTSCSRNSAMSSSVGVLAPCELNSSPFVNLPVIAPPLLDHVIDSTLSAETCDCSSV
jgi:hypothetical protein